MFRKGVGEEKPMLGIDVSQMKLDCTLVDPISQRRLSYSVVANAPCGVRELLDKIDPSVPWVLEPTGRWSASVVKQATEAGRKVLLAPTKAAQHFLKSNSPRAKTDKLDSYNLALFGLSRPLSAFPIKGEAVEKLDQILSARRGLSHSRQRLRLQRMELPYAADALDKAIEAIQEQINVLDKQIAEQVNSSAQFALARALMQIPGVGLVTAAAIASRLTSRIFAHPDAFVAYIGLDVAVRASGKSIGRVKLTKQGDAELRRLLFMAAMANLRCKESVFKDRYDQEIARGRSSTAALNIIARKIAHICWALSKYGGDFDPSRVYRKAQEAVAEETAA
jgi:transposase